MNPIIITTYENIFSKSIKSKTSETPASSKGTRHRLAKEEKAKTESSICVHYKI